MKTKLSLFLLFFLLSAHVAGLFAEPVMKDPAWEKYIVSRKKLQVALHHLMGLNWEHLKPAANKSQAFQLALADQQSMRFYFLKEFYPDKLVRDRGFESFVNFEWSKTYEKKLQKKNADYRKLLKSLAYLEKEIQLDLLYPEIEQKILTLSKDREYLEILARFRFIKEEVEEMLRHEAGQNAPSLTP